jgi:hypothetical protein
VSRLVDVSERPDLLKDVETGMIYVVDEKELNEYNAMKIRKSKANIIEQDINNLKSDIDDIKRMLTTLINK